MYDLSYTDGKVYEVVIPFLEFGAVNFSNNSNVECKQEESKMMFKTTRSIMKGEVIVQSPMTGSNTDTLVNTGFINLPVPNVLD